MTLFEHIETSTIQEKIEPDHPTVNDQFIIDKVQFNFPGEILAGSVSSNILVLALKDCRILWIDLDKPNSIKDIYLPSKDQQITGLYFSPLADQLIVSCHKDNYYITSDLKPKLFSKIKDQITSVAWSNHSKKISILIGTVEGTVYDAILTNDKRFEKSIVAIFTEKTPITGLYYFIIGSVLVVYISSKTHLYQYLSVFKALEDVQFSSIFSNPDTTSDVQEMIGGPNRLGIRIQSGTLNGSVYLYPEYLVWPTAPGIYSGKIQVIGGKEIGDTFLENIQLQPYPADIDVIDFTTTEFHYIILTRSDIIVGFEEIVVALFKDELKKTFWIATNQSLFEIIITEEGKNIWKIFVDRKQYKEALAVAANSDSRMLVSLAYAEHCYSQGEYALSADLFANTNIPLEQVAVRFSGLENSDALQSYLLKKISALKQSEYSQMTILLSWQLELMLSDLELQENLLETKIQTPYLEKIKAFIRNYKDKLHANTVYSLLRQHGREDIILYYAELINDICTKCDVHLGNQQYKDALSVLTTQNNPDLFYKHSPLLIQKIPNETILIWTRCDFLVPRNLLPSMLHYKKVEGEPNRIISYLEHIIRIGNRDRVIHNYLFQLYVEDSNSGLESVLNFIGNQQLDPIFDPQFALRICHGKKLIQPCVQLYGMLHMEEEAIILALKLEDESEMKKKLWLLLAKHVVVKNNDFKSALELCKEGNLKVEEVMQFFPDFVLIDDLKVELCDALRHYNENLQQLSTELDDSANNSELIRKDIRNLKTKYAMIPIIKLDIVKGIKLKAIENKKDDLEDLLSEECVLCGDLMIKTIDQILESGRDLL
ncbi:hypothetical protein HDV06_000219 [Boothiomyces sp. JEL0866]|nr:hypothetical protein HDV06_000219 [Boothiomyces sp. JEL0866]